LVVNLKMNLYIYILRNIVTNHNDSCTCILVIKCWKKCLWLNIYTYLLLKESSLKNRMKTNYPCVANNLRSNLTIFKKSYIHNSLINSKSIFNFFFQSIWYTIELIIREFYFGSQKLDILFYLYKCFPLVIDYTTIIFK
jgi:hypothetical protein